MKVELTRFLEKLQKVFEVMRPLEGKPLEGSVYTKLSSLLADDTTRDSMWASWETFKPFMGRPVNKDLLVMLTGRFFTFKGPIKAGIAPKLWDGSKAQAVFFCEGVIKIPSMNVPKLRVYLRCLLGEPAGLIFDELDFNKTVIEYWLGKHLGLSYRKYNAAAENITGCYFMADIEQTTCSTIISDVTTNTTMKKLNMQLMEARLDLHKCKTPMIECSDCEKARKECKLAVWRAQKIITT